MAQPPQNTKVSPAYINWILASNRGIMAHLYQFIAVDGANDYFTDFDLDIVYNGITWKSNALRFEGMHRKVGVGLNVDEQSLKIWAAPTDTLFGANFLTGAEEGLLDGSIIIRSRAIWQFVTGNVAADIQATPLAVWTLFTGYTATIEKGGASHIELKVKSALRRLDIDMPRNFYQPGCLWALFDAGCDLSKAAFTVTGTIGSGPNSRVIPVSGGVSSPNGADGIATYAQGRLLFTSGVNSNLQVLIDNNDSANLYLAYVLSDVPSPGDTISYWPGCSKSYNTCNVKFNNAQNFRGFDKVPPVMVSI